MIPTGVTRALGAPIEAPIGTVASAVESAVDAIAAVVETAVNAIAEPVKSLARCPVGLGEADLRQHHECGAGDEQDQ